MCIFYEHKCVSTRPRHRAAQYIEGTDHLANTEHTAPSPGMEGCHARASTQHTDSDNIYLSPCESMSLHLNCVQ